MNKKNWEKKYIEICKILKLDPEEDIKAAITANKLISNMELFPSNSIKNKIKNKKIIILGAADCLDSDFDEFFRENAREDFLIVAVDGVTSFLKKKNIIPGIIITDLDGNTEDIINANRNGAICVVHVHGDNINQFAKTLDKLKGPLIVTCQTDPVGKIKNYFGFTDGDRAVFFCSHYNPKSITIIGFDFGGETGPYSNPKKPYKHPPGKRKRKKLEIARDILSEFLLESDGTIIYYKPRLQG